MTGNSNLGEFLLILDCDHTLLNIHLHNLLMKRGFGDYGSDEVNAVAKEYLDELGARVKNGKQLKSVLQKALEQGVEVAIASFTSYPKAVGYVVQNHFGLNEEQANNIRVVGGMDQSFEKTDSKIRKNLHILYLLKAYKAEHGKLPQEVMLVDDDGKNVNCINDFHENIGELLAEEKNISSVLKNVDSDIAKIKITAEELQGIKFKGVQVPRGPITEANKEADDGYLGKVEKWVGQKRKKQVGFCENDNDVHVFERNRDAFIEHFRSLPPREALKELQESLSNLMIPPKDSTKDDIRRRQGLNKREIQLREDLIKEIQDRIEQQNKPPLWQKVGIMIAPPVIGAAIGSLALTGGVVGSLFLIATIVAVAATVVMYAFEEYCLKLELKPSEILGDCREAIKQMIHKPAEQGKA